MRDKGNGYFYSMRRPLFIYFSFNIGERLQSVNMNSTFSKCHPCCFDRLPIFLESIMAITFSER